MARLDPFPISPRQHAHTLRAQAYRLLADAEDVLAATPESMPVARVRAERPEPDLLTVHAAAERLALSDSQVYAMALDGRLESVQLGRARRIRRASVDRLLGTAPTPARGR